MTLYEEDSFLQLSGIQHFAFCRRQWALIHVENQWQENVRTIEGKLLHTKAHDTSLSEKRGDVIISRGMPIQSKELGFSGECDVVEFHRTEHGVSLFGRKGLYQVLPIEYKRGAPKETDGDRLQLAAQALCLEEMLCCIIPQGFLYYGETKRRSPVIIDDALRQQVKDIAKEMHQYFDRGDTPKVKWSKACNACSLKELCLPTLGKKKSVQGYVEKYLSEGGEE